MKSSSFIPRVVSISSRGLVAFGLLTVTVYICSSLLVVWTSNGSAIEFLFFNPGNNSHSLLNFILSSLMLSSGIIMILFLPGIATIPIFKGRIQDLWDLAAYSFVASTVLLVAGGSIFTLIMGESLGRYGFIGLISFSFVIVALFSYRKLTRNETILTISFKMDWLWITLLSVIILLCLFMIRNHLDGNPYSFDLSEEHLSSIALGGLSDELELVGVTYSLRKHAFPFWDLEYADGMGHYVINPPLRYFIFHHSVLLFGNAPAAFNIFFIAAWIVTLLVSYSISHLELEGRNRFVALLLPVSLAFVFFFSKDEDIFLIGVFWLIPFTSLLLHYYFLIKSRYGMSLCFAIIATLMAYEVVLFIFLGGLVFRQVYQEDRKYVHKLLREYSYFLLVGALFFIIMGILDGFTYTYLKAIVVEKLVRFDYFNFLGTIFPEQKELWPRYNIGTTLSWLKWLLVETCFLSLILLLPNRDKLSKFFRWIAMIYFFIVMIANYRRPHYTIPLVLLTMVVAPRIFWFLKNKLESIFLITG